jgi:hypothetical protein
MIGTHQYSDETLIPILEENNLDIYECKSDLDIFEILKITMKDWIVKKMESYSCQYEHLQKNWKQLCHQWNTEPKEILIVEFLPSLEEMNDGFKNYKIVEHIINILSLNGYIVRSKQELDICKKCHKAILSKNAYDYFKQKYIQHRMSNELFYGDWDDICISCKKL